MAVSDGTIFVILAQTMLVYMCYTAKIRLWKIIASAGIIMVGFGALAVEDTIASSLFVVASVIYGGTILLTQASEIVK